MFAAHSEEFVVASQKISNKFDIFLTASRGEFLTENSAHTRGNGSANCLARNFAQLFPSRVRRALSIDDGNSNSNENVISKWKMLANCPGYKLL